MTYVYIDMVFGFYGYFFLTHLYFLVACLIKHDYLDTCCFGCLICMCFVFAPVQQNWACFTWKGALEIRSFFLLLLAIFWLWVMIQVEDGYEKKVQVNGLVRQKDSEIKAKEEMERKELQFSSCNSKAEAEPFSLRPGPPRETVTVTVERDNNNNVLFFPTSMHTILCIVTSQG